ncbi:MAG: zf-TFIIB domain-containing protein [Sediminibacterium sp.]|nr:zf-TFIIB domain-containing protein [Sediminibacterium sp.]
MNESYFMKCPSCSESLQPTIRNQVEVDYCPSCRGIWLDRGELNKLLDFAAKFQQFEREDIPKPQAHRLFEKEFPKHSEPTPRRERPKSFLSDFFDFD